MTRAQRAAVLMHRQSPTAWLRWRLNGRKLRTVIGPAEHHHDPAGCMFCGPGMVIGQPSAPVIVEGGSWR